MVGRRSQQTVNMSHLAREPTPLCAENHALPPVLLQGERVWDLVFLSAPSADDAKETKSVAPKRPPLTMRTYQNYGPRTKPEKEENHIDSSGQTLCAMTLLLKRKQITFPKEPQQTLRILKAKYKSFQSVFLTVEIRMWTKENDICTS